MNRLSLTLKNMAAFIKALIKGHSSITEYPNPKIKKLIRGQELHFDDYGNPLFI